MSPAPELTDYNANYYYSIMGSLLLTHQILISQWQVLKYIRERGLRDSWYLLRSELMARSVSPPSYQVNVLLHWGGHDWWGITQVGSSCVVTGELARGLVEGNQIIKTNTRQEHHSGGQSGQVGQEGWELEFYSNPELARPAISHCQSSDNYITRDVPHP